MDLRRAVRRAAFFAFVFAAGSTAHANINSSLDAMWASSPGGSVSGQNGMGIYGPSYYMRAPVQNYQLLHIDPPRLSAGCSGIDSFFGSFSMLSSAQLESLVRNIIQAAPGYLMQLAIKAICDDCYAIMAAMKHYADMLNSGQINSCAVTKAVVGAAVNTVSAADSVGGTSALQTAAENAAGVAKGWYSDMFAGLNAAFTNGPNANRGARQNDTTGYRNSFFNTMFATGAVNTIDLGVFGGQEPGMELMMSLFGTSVVPDINNSPASTSPKDDKTFAATLTWSDLKEGYDPAKPRIAYQCNDFQANDEGCQQIQQATYTYQGIRRYLIDQLAGVQSAAPDSTAGQPGNIITAIQSGSIIDFMSKGVALTSTQQAFVGSLGVNMQQMIMELSSMNQNDALQIYNQLVDAMADQVTASVAYAIVSAVRQAYNPTTQASQSIDNTMKRIVPMSDSQKAALAQFERDAQLHNNFEERAHRVMMIVDELKTLGSESVAVSNTR
ncbi:conjugal transfer protein TraH [Paraburkholderia kururiensis]|uniref:conjugal transfer protein TraH n=1 Tax=Paraburkholderia kururiensis TaxID=984307 RepID=UPI000F890FA2|nr:conjugal transfer protein TraH [Paraburkholderia kururiensis]